MIYVLQLQTLQLLYLRHNDTEMDEMIWLCLWLESLYCYFCSIRAMLGQCDVLVTEVNARGVISTLDSGLSVKCTKLNKNKVVSRGSSSADTKA